MSIRLKTAQHKQFLELRGIAWLRGRSTRPRTAIEPESDRNCHYKQAVFGLFFVPEFGKECGFIFHKATQIIQASWGITAIARTKLINFL
ncbi:hypothetical protein CEK71_10925 [Methylovulum psychrotolerans]|uniref:Uncharacterized protein n=1 Tax=Methylovulum psychrotolerans TaxID=1704499 RepID=A0A1Z4BZ55_9GAMM|nr:hypothetical protein CEK71_10925 [Methylovulum psychrotolerans]